MNLTTEEISVIANRLHEVITYNFHDSVYNTCVHRLREDNDYEISDEDVIKIKDKLKQKL